MKHPQLPGYLCLSDLLDQNLSAYEYFQTLSPEVQSRLQQDDGVTTFEDLQARAAHYQQIQG